MNRKKRLTHHKTRHNNKNRHTQKKFKTQRASGQEPGVENKKQPVDRLSDPLDEKVRQKWLKSQEHKPCCDDENGRAAKNQFLLNELNKSKCDMEWDPLANRWITKVVPRWFIAKHRAHISHFKASAVKRGYVWPRWG